MNGAIATILNIMLWIVLIGIIVLGAKKLYTTIKERKHKIKEEEE